MKLHHGGKLVEHPLKMYIYVGGNIDFIDYPHFDTMSLVELDKLAEKLGYVGGVGYIYLQPRTDFQTGLVFVLSDDNALDMAKIGAKFGEISLYMVEPFLCGLLEDIDRVVEEIVGAGAEGANGGIEGMDTGARVDFDMDRQANAMDTEAEGATGDIEGMDIGVRVNFDKDRQANGMDTESKGLQAEGGCDTGEASDDDTDSSDGEVLFDSDYDLSENDDMLYDTYVNPEFDWSDVRSKEKEKMQEQVNTTLFDVVDIEVQSEPDNSSSDELQSICSDEENEGVTKYIRFNPKIDMQNPIFRNGMVFTDAKEFKAAVRSQYYRTRRKVNDMLNGHFTDQYARLWDYTEELKKSNPNSTVVMKTEVDEKTGDERFLRLYICFDACEDKQTWKWFLELLIDDVAIYDQQKWTIVSDGQKGLPALFELLPDIEHRFCVRHMYNNFKKEHSGLALKDRVWNLARASTINQFNFQMDSLKDLDEGAHQWLSEVLPTHWSRSHFRTSPKCDILLNNLCESFNSGILEGRNKPFLNMVEALRVYLMKRLQSKRDCMAKWTGDICLKILKRMEKLKDATRGHISTYAGAGKFEVRDMYGQYKVDLMQQSCSCRRWDLCGIPCVHAMSAIMSASREPEESYQKTVKCKKCGKSGHNKAKCTGSRPVPPPAAQSNPNPTIHAPPNSAQSDPTPATYAQPAVGPDVDHIATTQPVVQERAVPKKRRCSVCLHEGHYRSKCPYPVGKIEGASACGVESSTGGASGHANIGGVPIKASFLKKGQALCHLKVITNCCQVKEMGNGDKNRNKRFVDQKGCDQHLAADEQIDECRGRPTAGSGGESSVVEAEAVAIGDQTVIVEATEAVQISITVEVAAAGFQPVGEVVGELTLEARELTVGALELTVGALELIVGALELTVGVRELTFAATGETFVGVRELTVLVLELTVGATMELTFGFCELIVIVRELTLGVRELTVGVLELTVGVRELTVVAVRELTVGVRELTIGSARQPTVGVRELAI
ncbi:hypothetical protein BUALT_Bualt14G0127100 [Buddleja alternifolia]|uniref:SWIM-type domain-containing protein n=1 Tax=Buddleja alternifolia TaxID=168488 RepID=A0AAV6WNP5_9LAMI|nr:hypothetical protein BUALT_Bualt14G0127100 [Buddleja alternifolia]